MLKLQGERIYLATLEREHCRTLWATEEFDPASATDRMYIGNSVEKADDWFEEILKLQHNQHLRLGIFLHDGTVIGDAALQNFDWFSRRCSIGVGIAQLAHRSKGYGSEAVRLLLGYAFDHLGLHRVEANTSSRNPGAQKSIERCGFSQEGVARQAEYLFGKYCDTLNYGLLREEYDRAGHSTYATGL